MIPDAVRAIQRLDRQLRSATRPQRRGERERSARVPAYPADVWAPLPDRPDGSARPQRVAFDHGADEMYYGGGAGGGKTDLLLGLALTAHRRSIIFRRETEQVTGIEERLIEILASDAGYNRNKHRLHATVGGTERRVRLGGMQRERDWQRYQGQPFDLTAFDELPHFMRSQFRAVIGWNRTATPGQRTRVVGAGNPPVRPEEEWVLSEFAPWLDPDFEGDHGQPTAAPGELRWYRYVEGKPEGQDIEWYTAEALHKDEGGRLYLLEDDRRVYPKSRTFIQALVDDNPVYMETGYAERLEALPEPLRSLMRSGAFGVDTDDDPWQVIPTAWVDAAMARWRALHADGPYVPAVPLTALGVDPARGGKDAFTVAPRWGTYVGEIVSQPGSEVPNGQAGAALVLNFRDTLGGGADTRLVVDTIGVGAAPYDFLPEDARDAFVASARSEATDRTGTYGFRNLRAEAWWAMRERLDPRLGDDVALPPSRALRSQLAAPRFRIAASGIEVEPKEGKSDAWGVKNRLGRSTDDADAVIHAFHEAEAPPEALVLFA